MGRGTCLVRVRFCNDRGLVLLLSGRLTRKLILQVASLDRETARIWERSRGCCPGWGWGIKMSLSPVVRGS